MSFQAIGPISDRVSTFEADGGLLSKLADLLRQSNGFAMWGGAFVILPSGNDAVLPSIEAFNRGEWKKAYPKDVAETTFFAVDAFGFPFGISQDAVVQLDPEIGSLSPIAATLGELFEKVRSESWAPIGLSAFEKWRQADRELRLGQCLAPKIPFVMGGGKEVDDFYAADILDRAAFNAYIYEQIKDLPDGATVELKAVP